MIGGVVGQTAVIQKEEIGIEAVFRGSCKTSSTSFELNLAT